MTDENESLKPVDPNDPFADCVLAKAGRDGTYSPNYRYKGNSLPKTKVRSAPGWSVFEHVCKKLAKNK